MTSPPVFATLGCRLNAYETEAMKELAAAAGGIEAEVRMRRHQWSRYSNRQRQEMDLTGLVGEVILRGDLAPFHEFLALGELLHLGKNATFGLGRYHLTTEIA